MKCLFLVVLFSTLIFGARPQEPSSPPVPRPIGLMTPNLAISLVSQITLPNSRVPKAKRKRRVEFRLENKSGKSVNVRIDGDANRSHLIGDNFRYDKRRKKWIKVSTDMSHEPGPMTIVVMVQSLRLSPGISVVLDTIIPYDKPGEFVRKDFYVSFEGDKQEMKISSPAFILK